MATYIQTLKSGDDQILPRTRASAVETESGDSVEDVLGDKYEKPSGGIPKTDLSSSVQSSLELADSAIQSLKTINGSSIVGSGNITVDGAKAFVATYGTTTASEIDSAVTAGKAVFCKYSNGGVTHQLMLVDESGSKYGFAESTVGTNDGVTSVSGITIALSKGDDTWEVLTGSSSIPTKTSDLTNDSGFLTEHQSLKTINGDSIVGSGNLSISGGSSIDDTTTATDKTWSSNKINTEIGVFKAVLTINCVDSNGSQVTGNTVSVIGVKSEHTYYSGTYSGAAISVSVMNESEIKIVFGTYSTYITPPVQKFVIGGNTTKTGVYRTDVVYGFHVDADESDPSDAVTYLTSAIGMTPAAMDFVNDEFDYGSWENAFFMPRPCMLKSDGTVDYYLDPSDFTKKENGTSSDVANTSYDGNAMIEWGQGTKIWYKVVPDDDDDCSGSVYIASSQVDSDYKSWSFIDSENDAIDHFYTPIYNGSLVDSKLRSLSGQACINTNTAQNEVTYAKANNTTSAVEWYTEVFADRQLIDLLLILMSKSLDTQMAFGFGHYTGGSSASNLLATGTMNDKGMFWGTNQSGYGVKVFGMENFWGNQWRRTAGLMFVSSKLRYKMTYNNADGSTSTSYNFDGSGYIENSFNITGTSGGYISIEKFVSGIGTLPCTVSGSSSTYYSDGCWFSNGTMYALFGGICSDSFLCGGFTVDLHYAPSGSAWTRGASLSCKPIGD